MKSYKLLFLMFFLFIGRIVNADVIPLEHHWVNKCIKITNINDYADITLLGYIIRDYATNSTYVITSVDCLVKEYKYNGLNIYAVNKSYLTGKDLNSIDWTKDKHAVKTTIPIDCYEPPLPDSIPVTSIEEYYNIAGFKTDSVVVYKWKSVYKFSNGRADSINNYTYKGDATKLSPSILSNITNTHYDASITLFPNPVQKSIHLKFEDYNYGIISIKLLTPDGKIVKSFVENKLITKTDFTIPIDNLPKGFYFIKINNGLAESTKRIIIE